MRRGRTDNAPPDAGAVAADLARTFGHGFARPELLREALTHPSAAVGTPSYERLEFLGDRVLAIVIADLLLRRFPDAPEGDLARRHVDLVRREALVEVARAIGHGRHLLLSRGEDEAGARDNPSILADSLEAVIAALYLDGGLPAAAGFIARHWTAMMERPSHPPQDAKTALQEWVQGQGKPLPVYRILAREGPAHEPVFSVELTVEGALPVTARGPSKRAAEQVAAAALLDKLSPTHGAGDDR